MRRYGQVTVERHGRQHKVLALWAALLAGGGFILWWMSRPFRVQRAKIDAARARAEILARRLFEEHKGSPIPTDALEAAAQEVISLCETAPVGAAMSLLRRRYLRELASDLDGAKVSP